VIRYVALLFCLLTAIGADCQVASKAEKAFARGKELMRKQKTAEALRQFDRAIRADPSFYEPYAERARLLLREEDGRAEDALLAMLALDPVREPTAWLALARLAKAQKRYADAGRYADQFVELAGDQHRQYAEGVALRDHSNFIVRAMAEPVPFEPEALGPAINDPNVSQYGAVSSRKDDLLVFTRRIGGQEDFFYAQREGDDFTISQPLVSLNTPQNEGMHTLSRDGRTMVFTWCHDRSSYGSCDLYETSLLHDGRWRTPTNMGPEINTKYWDAQPSLSTDGNILVWSSTRPGGPGESNLWWSKKDRHGNWGSAQLLPGKVNSAGREQTPFLHADGITLYFASTGHQGMGDFDLFVSRYHVDSGWLRPVNLGYPINTTGHEGALSVGLDGKTAYFATDRWHEKGGESHLMIYRFHLPELVRGTPVTYVEGQVVDARNKHGLAASVLIQQEGSEEVRHIEANEKGEFFLTLASGNNYALQLKHEGYLFYSSRFELQDSNAFRPYQLSIALHPLDRRVEEKAKRLVLQNILFEVGKSSLLPASQFELREVLDLLQRHPSMRIRLEGHTDNLGSDDMNMLLSQERAASVRGWLIANGIEDSRIEAVGYGSTRPIADNNDPAGRRLNRRTELLILP
jgi:outer membrane protein OmpA-like peptidoglycan-associated protein/Tfp pilus assembly protein PilF